MPLRHPSENMNGASGYPGLGLGNQVGHAKVIEVIGVVSLKEGVKSIKRKGLG